MKPFAQWEWNQHWDRSIDEALEELERESRMRLKCYDRWIAEGRSARVESFNRMEALLTAVRLLREYQQILSAQTAAGPMVLPDPAHDVNDDSTILPADVADVISAMRTAAG